MKYSINDIEICPEILKRTTGHELIVPIELGKKLSNPEIKAGTPVYLRSGKYTPANDPNTQASAGGILLNDVNTLDNPNGAMLKAFGVVDVNKAQRHCGIEYTQGLVDHLSKISFEGEFGIPEENGTPVVNPDDNH